MSEALYDRDFQLWIEKTIQQLQNHEFEALDIEHLIEELVDLGRSERNTLRSNLMILLAHLLKLQVQADAPDTMKGSWYSSILEHRQRVLNHLADTPSLKSFLVEAVEKAYGDGRKLAIKEGQLARLGCRVLEKSEEYPIICPFSIDQILDEDFYGV
ncbi:MAG: DUF29 domain-containing protein [Synechococcales cyanobacterium CRU_2_2]|nr:DUF29 domain-containing protein [Synechococcales cyanobacterium CRU_2_2]